MREQTDNTPPGSPALPSQVGAMIGHGHGPQPFLLGDFELRRVIGRGGMGTVYEGWQRSLQRIVAVKVLAAHICESPKAVARFQREAQAAAKLHHTHIIPIFARGEEKGMYYYAMELINGRTLSDVIVEARDLRLRSAETVSLGDHDPQAGPTDGKGRKSGDLTRVRGRGTATRESPGAGTSSVTLGDATVDLGSAAQFTAIARHVAAVADALEYAHAQGVIHRDIKPHNLMLGDDGRMRIGDFGLARLAEQPGVTMTGEVVGSPLYMPPEQISGEPGKVDHRADIYSLGATLYEWLTLSPPHVGETRETVIRKILSDEPLLPRAHNADIPFDLETICLKAMQRDPAHRYRSAAAFRDDLRRFCERQPILARRASMVQRASRLVARYPLASFAAIAGVVTLTLVWAFVEQGQELKERKAEVVQATAEATRARADQERLVELVAGLVPGGSAATPMIEGLATAAMRRGGFWDSPEGDPRGRVRSGEAVGPGAAPAGLPGGRQGGPRPASAATLSGLAERTIGELLDALWDAEPPNDPDETVDDYCTVAIESALQRRITDPAGASVLLDPCLEREPDQLRALHLRTALIGQLGRFEEMLKSADRLATLRADEAAGYLWRGLARLMLKQPGLGLEDFERAAQLAPESPWVGTLRGLALISLHRPTEAIDILDRALEVEPDLVIALLSRAVAYRHILDLSPAIADLTRVIEIEPNNADVLVVRGMNFAAALEFDAAIADFAQATRIAGTSGEMLVLYAQVLSARKMHEDLAKRAGDADGQAAAAEQPPEPAAPQGDFDWFSNFDWSGAPQEGRGIQPRRPLRPDPRQRSPFDP